MITLHWKIEMKRFVTALVFVVAASVSAFAQNLPLPSKWQNQRNSTIWQKPRGCKLHGLVLQPRGRIWVSMREQRESL
jgi:hypothetical protein